MNKIKKRIILGICIPIAIFLLAYAEYATEENVEIDKGPFHFVTGFVFYNNSLNPSKFALINITNTDRGETEFTTTDEYGFYSFNCGSFSGPGWAPGENITITAYGNSSQCWTNWTGFTIGTVPDITSSYNITMETWLNFYDVGIEGINYPSNNSTLCPSPINYTINATVVNFGNSYNHTFPVEIYIYNESDEIVYSDLKMVTLPPGETSFIEFDSWEPSDKTENYTILVTTNMSCPNHDYIPSTDSKQISVHVTKRVMNMEVNKKVWNNGWNDSINTIINTTVSFNISIKNNGTCCDLANITVFDFLPFNMGYVYNSTFINGFHAVDPIISDNILEWNSTMLGIDVLDEGNSFYIEFNATVVEWGKGVNNVTVNAKSIPLWENLTASDSPGATVNAEANIDAVEILFKDKTEIENSNISTNFSFIAYAGGYNDTYGFIGFINANWSIINYASNASINATHGKSIEFNSGWNDGTAILTAEYNGHNDTVTFNINSSLFSFILYKGWNLVTLPCENDYNAYSLYSNIDACSIILSWNSSVQDFIIYVPGSPYNFAIENGHGYFVGTNNNSIFSLADIPIQTVNITLYIGWNILGWFNSTPTTASSLLENITGCNIVLGWNTSVQDFELYAPGVPNDFVIARGDGFLIAVGEESIWHREIKVK
ncbi:MAG TPA: hypothetical protein ENI33_02460 [Thermoplasmatales archaeon]|nr:hypothetical protein [Thermoplasmatales archaeon]